MGGHIPPGVWPRYIRTYLLMRLGWTIQQYEQEDYKEILWTYDLLKVLPR